MSDLVGNSEDRFSHNEAHTTAGSAHGIIKCLPENEKEIYDMIIFFLVYY